MSRLQSKASNVAEPAPLLRGRFIWTRLRVAYHFFCKNLKNFTSSLFYTQKGTVEEGNFVLEHNFVQKSFFARIIAHLFSIEEGTKFFFA